jgi:hypothetical protein
VRIGKIEVKRRVWVGLGFALLATAAWWSWTRGTPPAGLVKAPVKPSFVRVTGVIGAGTDRVMRERAELLDPTPLFFPTDRNYGQRPLPRHLDRQPGQVFGSFESRPIFEEGQKLKIYGLEASPAPEKLSDVLVQGNEAPFAGMGRIDSPRPALPARAAFLEVRGLGQKKAVIAQPLTEISAPRLDYGPLEFLITVGSAGLVGDPVLTSGSGWEEVDAFFRTYLVRTFRVGERLDPGRYRVLVGP